MTAQRDAADLDLTQFQGAFFEEAAEHLAAMESLLVRMDLAAPTRDDLDAIFRAAHSIKGGSGMFRFTDMTTLTHELESLLDRVRKRELRLTAAMVDVLLQSSDLLREQLAFYSGQAAAPGTPVTAMCGAIRACAGAGAAPLAPSATATPPPAPPLPARVLHLTVAQGQDGVALPPDLAEQLRELGTLTELPATSGKRRRKAATQRSYELVTNAPVEVVVTLFEFVMDSSRVKIEERAGPGAARALAHDPAVRHPAALTGHAGDDAGYGFFEPIPDAPAAPPPASTVPGDALNPGATRGADRAAIDTSIRVSVEKVDQLINQVGELVITQAMLAQSVGTLDTVRHERLLAAMADLERNTRDLQESVMSIRMLPIAFVFNRFPRLVRDLAAKLSKEVRLVTQGEATELDKGLIERISDPLTHLVRNSIDHGIETPAARAAAGKPPCGIVTLRAAHQGGNILIEVSDDGAGLDRERILAKARERARPRPRCRGRANCGPDASRDRRSSRSGPCRARSPRPA